MSICLCYHDEQNFLHERGVCYGTKEKEPCSCGGNPVKCDFYEEVKEKYIHRTNADRIRQMSDEELADFLGGIFTIETDIWGDYDPRLVVMQEPRVEIRDKEGMMDWLKSPVEEGEQG